MKSIVHLSEDAEEALVGALRNESEEAVRHAAEVAAAVLLGESHETTALGETLMALFAHATYSRSGCVEVGAYTRLSVEDARRAAIEQVYDSKRGMLRAALDRIASQDEVNSSSRFREFRWRLDVELASKRHEFSECILPSFVCRLRTNAGEEWFQSEFSALQGLRDELKSAEECLLSSATNRWLK